MRTHLRWKLVATLILLWTLCVCVAVADDDGDYYAAIAYSQSTGRYGYAYGSDTRADAEERARHECDESDARVVTWARNQWVALATSSWNSAYGYTSKPTAAEAQEVALDNCSEHGGGGRVVVLVYANHKNLKPARVRIWVPTAEAQVTFGGQAVSGEGLVRDYETPELEPGKQLQYEVKARVGQAGSPNGTELSVTVDVRCGCLTEVVFAPTGSPSAYFHLLHPVQEKLHRPSAVPDDEIPAVPMLAP